MERQNGGKRRVRVVEDGGESVEPMKKQSGGKRSLRSVEASTALRIRREK